MVRRGTAAEAGWRMDAAALAALAGERIGWRHKGFPARFDGWTVGDVVHARPAVAEFATPLMVLDAAALEHNLATMARFCATHGVDLAPHAKTTMAPQLVARQLAAGAWGVTAATIAHVRAVRAFGVDTVVLANPLVDVDALAWVAGEMRRSARFRLVCFADSVAGVEIMRAALDAAASPRPVDVVVDLGWPGARTGCRDADTAETVARAVRTAGRLRLVGAGGFEGALAHDRSAAGLGVIRAYLATLRDLVRRLDTADLFDEADEIVVTAGGSAYFDAVVEILRDIGPASRPVRTVLRSGAYLAHGDGEHPELTPFTGPDAFRAALRIRGRVLSLPEPGLALLDFGKRDAPVDLGLPRPLAVTRRDGVTGRLDGCAVTALADQHAFLSYAPPTRLAIGDVVSCGITHPCTAFDKWRLIPIVDGDHVVDVVTTFF